MVDRYSPLLWNDGPAGGTPASVARGPRRWEAGIEALDVGLDELEDRVDAIQALLSQIGVGDTDRVVTSATRGTPTAGRRVYDTDLDQPLWGDGVAWRDAVGDLIGGSGGGAAPTGVNAVVVAGGTIGQVNISWPTVSGATAITVRESRNPSGESGGVLAGSATSFTRTPATSGQYTYWITATIGGVETAPSNSVTVSLPYVAPGGPPPDPPATSPAALLNINSSGSGNYFNCGIGYQSGHVDKTMAQLISGFSESPYFVLNSAATAVRFQVFCNGARTSSNTKYPRSELRELTQNGTTKAAWNISQGTHVMQGKTKVLHLPPNKPWVTIAQLHDAESDTMAIKVKGDSTSALHVACTIYDEDHSTKLMTSYTLGNEIDWKIEFSSGGIMKVYIGGVLKITSNATQGKGSGHYWKCGCYIQTGGALNNNPASEYGLLELRDFDVTHTG